MPKHLVADYNISNDITDISTLKCYWKILIKKVSGRNMDTVAQSCIKRATSEFRNIKISAKSEDCSKQILKALKSVAHSTNNTKTF